jgi:hypothetical protein
MIGVSEVAPSEVCDRVKQLGYVTGSHIHLYGERFEVVSDPFPEDNGIAVCVRSAADTAVRVIQLPVTVLQTAKEHEEMGHPSA